MSEQVANGTRCAGMARAAALGALLLVVLIALLIALLIVAQAGSGSRPGVLITELYPNTATKDEPDEYLAITNPSSVPVNLEGWRITDTEGSGIFPAVLLPPARTVYIARNATAFVEHLRLVRAEAVQPAFEYGADSDPAVPQLRTTGKPLVFRNAGDELILYDAAGSEVDVVLFGEGSDRKSDALTFPL